jgi:hypothetical protein
MKSDACKTRGLAEKEAATQRKLEVAMKILDRRHEDIPVDVERREDDPDKKRWVDFCMKHT